MKSLPDLEMKSLMKNRDDESLAHDESLLMTKQ